MRITYLRFSKLYVTLLVHESRNKSFCIKSCIAKTFFIDSIYLKYRKSWFLLNFKQQLGCFNRKKH